MSGLRRAARQLLHSLVLNCGFSLSRVKPFERALLKYQLHHDDFFVVQVGAYNGVTSDPFCKFMIEGSWSGVLVEPQRRYHAVLSEIYRDRPGIVCRNVAIGAANEQKQLYRIKDDAAGLPYWAPQIASFRYEVVAGHGAEIPNIAELIVAEEVQCLTLDALVQQAALPRVDLLAIDVEGSDFEVVRQIDSLAVGKPKFIYYEHLHLSADDYQSSLRFLEQRGYRLHAVNAGDTFAELLRA